MLGSLISSMDFGWVWSLLYGELTGLFPFLPLCIQRAFEESPFQKKVYTWLTKYSRIWVVEEGPDSEYKLLLIPVFVFFWGPEITGSCLFICFSPTKTLQFSVRVEVGCFLAAQTGEVLLEDLTAAYTGFKPVLLWVQPFGDI